MRHLFFSQTRAECKVQPVEHSWRDVSLPKRCLIDNYAGTQNCIACITNPGRQPGRLYCKLEGCRIIFETFRYQSDAGPISVREETYPSEEYAEVTFYVLNMALGKVAAKSNKSFLLSF